MTRRLRKLDCDCASCTRAIDSDYWNTILDGYSAEELSAAMGAAHEAVLDLSGAAAEARYHSLVARRSAARARVEGSDDVD